MVRFFKFVILVIVAVVILVLAFANRHDVTVSFDPFATGDNAAFSIAAPLFAVVIASAMLGVVAGAFATWLSQGRHRRVSRQNRIEADKWRAQAQALKTAHAGDASRPALPKR
jgi:uncharacterized integral membrane protein